MSFSSSTSDPTTVTQNTQTTGAAGGNSPTINTQGAVNFTDAGQTANALLGMGQVALAALDAQGGVADSALTLLSDFNARQAQAATAQTGSSNDLLSSVLANNQTLAQNVQSGGATVGMALTTKIVWGVIALAGVVVAIVLFKK